MTTIQYSKELLSDFDKLLTDFTMFMTFNLMHQDKDLDPTGQAKMKQLIRDSLDKGKVLGAFFEKPLLNYEKKNKEQLMKNLPSILKILYEYVRDAEPILVKYKPALFQGRFTQIKKHYTDFHNTYLK